MGLSNIDSIDTIVCVCVCVCVCTWILERPWKGVVREGFGGDGGEGACA